MVTREQLERLAPPPPRPGGPGRQRRRGGLETVEDLDGWIAEHGLAVASRRTDSQGGELWILAVCPFDPSHANDGGGGGSACIRRDQTGRLGFRCQHASCSENDWKALRALLEPDTARSATRNQAQVLVGLAEGAELYRDPGRVAYADLPINGHRETWPVRSREVRDWLAGRFFAAEGKPPSREALDSTIGILAGNAIFGRVERHVDTRVARHPGAVYLDLCDPEWRCVEVDGSGWRVLPEAPGGARFRRARGMLALPTPERGGSLAGLAEWIADEEALVLCASWLLGALSSGPYPVLVLGGEQGTGKTTLAKVLRGIVDPSVAPARSMPASERDLAISARNSYVCCYDNLSGLSPAMSDALCRLATGGGLATRELYSDSDEIIFAETRPIILTGIGDIVRRHDLLDRAILVRLTQIGQVETEADLWRRYEAERPRLLGALLDAVSTALARHESVELRDAPRMADYARWLLAAEPALPAGWDALSRYRRNRAGAVASALEDDPLGQAVLELGRRPGGWSGTSADLLSSVTATLGEGVRPPRGWPATPRALAAAVERLATFARAAGVEVRRCRTTDRARRRLWVLTSTQDGPAQPSEPSEASYGHGDPADGSASGPSADRPPASTCDDWPSDGSDGSDGRVGSADGRVRPCWRCQEETVPGDAECSVCGWRICPGCAACQQGCPGVEAAS